MELRIDAAELAGSLRPVTGLDLYPAHRQRLFDSPHRAEPFTVAFGCAQQIDVDLDLVHVLHAADVRVPEFLVCVQERALALDTRGRVDHLVAMDVAAPALELVLGTEREIGRMLRWWLHVEIVGIALALRKT